MTRVRRATCWRMASKSDGAAKAARAPFARVLGILSIVAMLHVVGLFLFTSGFLLQRVELNAVSNCSKPAVSVWHAPRPPSSAAQGDEMALRAWDELLEKHGECTLPPRFQRVVLWIVDALRYDFVAEAQASDAFTPNAFMHNHIRTPAMRANATPHASFLAHFVAHPPTTTLQRLKGLTTGSLPTFIEAGANFGGAGRINEDTWIAQMRQRVSKRLSFVGDDTWQMVFADLFDDTHPYSSFNVEDLDTVDAGVEVHMLDTMDRDDWSLIVAHSLGVDHVGHRFGPAHARMPPKLQQMDDILQRVLSKLQDDTLFVFLGDHGMDATGDHGGDSELEVGSALWMYANKPFDMRRSKTPLSNNADVAALLRSQILTPAFQPFSMLPNQLHRSLPQIDLVPTLSLLLGVPIPFNSLGAIIPEVFASEKDALHAPASRLLRALRINARQVKTYLDAYAQQSTDLSPFAAELDQAWRNALTADARLAERASLEHARATAEAYLTFVRLALDRAQRVWAQFDYARMVLGMSILTCSIGVIWLLWRLSKRSTMEALSHLVWRNAFYGCWYGITTGVAMTMITRISVLESLVGGVALGVACTLMWHMWPGNMALDAFSTLSMRSVMSNTVACILILGHALLFASNSFTMWEDRITLGMVCLLLIARAWMGLGAPLTRWQQQIPIISILALLLLRFAGMSRVCREEQAPYCAPSFYAYQATTKFADNPAYALSGPATNSPYALAAAYLFAFAMADILRRILKPSHAHLSSASTLLTWIIRPALLGSSGFWLADWVHGLEQLDEATRSSFLVIKIWTARAVLLLLLAGAWYWYMSPLSLSVLREPTQKRDAPPKVALLGFGNTFGAAFLLFTSLAFSLLFLLSQPMGQLALSACFVAMVLIAELGDYERDARLLAASKMPNAKDLSASPTHAPSLLEIVCIGLIGFVAFFSTGHQATFTAIQWRVAFVGFPVVTYPWSPLFVVLNAFGPLSILPAFGVVLLTLWNVAPTRAKVQQEETGHVRPMRLPGDILHSALGLLLYVGVLTWSAALWACFFRRHLMLFKIWVPRYMMAGMGLLITDVALLGAVAVAWWIAARTAKAFGTLYT